ncbi:MAG: zinc-binding dehydrogenase [Nocardioides sp.]
MLVNGGGGGSGMFAIQLAARAGAHVTAVDNAGKLDFMRSLGADEVVDYRAEDPFDAGAAYDLILDLVAHRSVFAYRRALAPGGRYRVVGGTTRTLLRVLTVGALAGLATGRRLGVLGVRSGSERFAPVAGCARPATSPCTSTGCSTSTAYPKRWRGSAPAGPSARWSSGQIGAELSARPVRA